MARYIEDYVRDVELLTKENAELRARVAELEKELDALHVQEGGELPAPDDRQLGFSFSKFGTPGCASQCSTFTVGVPVALPVAVYACSCGTVKCGRCS